MTQDALAEGAGVSIRTVSRILNAEDLSSFRSSTIERIAHILGFGEGAIQTGLDPLVVVDLPFERLVLNSQQLKPLVALQEAAAVSRVRSDILAAFGGRFDDRLSSARLEDNDLYFDWIGGGIRWSRESNSRTRVLDMSDKNVARAAAERYWKALITGEPVFQYTRTPSGLEFMVLTFATDRDTTPSVLSMSVLGRPDI